MMSSEINVAFADDHAGFRKAVRLILEEAADIRVVGESEDGPHALADLQLSRPDVAILDLDMPGCDGLEVARAVRDLHLPIKTILLTAHRNVKLVDLAREAGVSAYVLKENYADIVDCVRAVHAAR